MSDKMQPWEPERLAAALEYAKAIAKSQLIPPAFRGKPEDVLLAMQFGAELGLPPLRALQNVAVINSRPSLWGDAMLGLILSKPDCEDVVESYDGAGDQLTAVCVVKRKGRSEVRREFSVADAKTAGLWGRKGPWTDYRKRMLQMRARGFALRDAYADALCGVWMAEESMDIDDRQEFVAQAIEAETKEPKTKKLAKKLKAAKEPKPEEAATKKEPEPEDDGPIVIQRPREEEPWEKAQAMADKVMNDAMGDTGEKPSAGEASSYETMREWIKSAKTGKRLDELAKMVPKYNMSDDERGELRKLWFEKMEKVGKED